jgi:Holliday junction resolvasome RuvABC endonuclease subunit
MILAYDIGRNLGWAMFAHGKVTSGVEKLPNKKSKAQNVGIASSLAAAQQHIAAHMLIAATETGLRAVAYEQVRRHLGTDAAHAYGAYMGIFALQCHQSGVPFVGYGVAHIKKLWTGKGNANKIDMIREARRRGFYVADDNEADALAVLNAHMIATGWPDGIKVKSKGIDNE